MKNPFFKIELIRSLIIGVCFLLTLAGYTQSFSLSGVVKDVGNSSIPFALVKLNNASLKTVSDIDGNYIIKNIPTGTYELQVYSVGFITVLKTLTITENTSLDFKLREEVKELKEVVIKVKSKLETINESVISTRAIDTKELHSSSVEVVDVLDESAGLRVRKQGGLGGQNNLMLNGLSGNAVRTYYDGVLLDLLGGAVSLATLPINMIDRIDVYKGITPVDVGTDALGGGINIIPRKLKKNTLDLFYEVGSFNTHRASLNVFLINDSSFFVGFNSFFNTSQNNYKMDVENIVYKPVGVNGALKPTGSEIIEVERFHSAHRSYFTELVLGVRDKRLADELKYSVSYSERLDELQHSARVYLIPAGEATSSQQAIIQNLRYKKYDLFKGKLSLDYFVNVGLIDFQNKDSSSSIYDWNGDIVDIKNTSGAELIEYPSSLDLHLVSTAQRFTAKLKLNKRHKLILSDFYMHGKIQGTDPYGEKFNGQDLNKIPAYFKQNIIGSSIDSKWLKSEKLSSSIFIKRYDYSNDAVDVFKLTGTEIPRHINTGRYWGNGLGMRYDLKENWFIRSSYEKAIRIPNRIEVYGDYINTIPNYDLLPEKSNNYNFGTVFKHQFNKSQKIKIDFGGFYRQQFDLIVYQNNNIYYGRFVNQSQVSTSGYEFILAAHPIKPIKISFNMTKQKSIIADVVVAKEKELIGKQISNIPTFFHHTSVSYLKDDFTSKHHELALTWKFSFIGEFTYIQEGGVRNNDNYIPKQITHGVELKYFIPNKKISFSLVGNNLLNAKVYDNLSVQKAGRNFRLKVRYLFEK